MKGNCAHFLGLAFTESETLAELPGVAVVHIGPSQSQKIAYSQGSVGPYDNHGVVSELPTELEIGRHGAEVGFGTDRFSGWHGGVPLVHRYGFLQKGDSIGNLLWNQYVLYHGIPGESRGRRIDFR